jgi:hypothetical protein
LNFATTSLQFNLQCLGHISSEHRPQRTLLSDIQILPRILLWNIKIPFTAGLLRQKPVIVRSNPKSTFPYPCGVQANLERWSEFVANDRREDIHPLIKGVWNTLYYVSVYPFPDGNGRISRILFAAHVAKHGMIPVICTDGLSREQYLKNVYSARTKNPHLWCKDVILAQIEVLDKRQWISPSFVYKRGLEVHLHNDTTQLAEPFSATAAYACRFPGSLGGVAEQNAYRYAAGLVLFSSGAVGNSQSSTAPAG